MWSLRTFGFPGQTTDNEWQFCPSAQLQRRVVWVRFSLVKFSCFQLVLMKTKKTPFFFPLLERLQTFRDRQPVHVSKWLSLNNATTMIDEAPNSENGSGKLFAFQDERGYKPGRDAWSHATLMYVSCLPLWGTPPPPLGWTPPLGQPPHPTRPDTSNMTLQAFSLTYPASMSKWYVHVKF